MVGLFEEMGPCTLRTDSTATDPNPYSWNNNASVLFLDQPSGTGLSSIKPGTQLPATDHEGAVDFQNFLNIISTKIFPNHFQNPIHIAGESYGGHYVPTYLHHILQSRRLNSRNAFQGNITSIILVNALFDVVANSIGSYELLCTDFRGEPILNATSCENMASEMPECSKLGDICHNTHDLHICWLALSYCQENVDKYFTSEAIAGKRDPSNSEAEP